MSSSSASGSSTSPINGGSEEEPTIKLLRAEYYKADMFCQEVQSFLNLAGVPALNELRNAGKHLIDAMDDKGDIARPADIALGIAHCRRACYEAYEAGILSALEVIEKFRRDYQTVPVDGVLANYVETLQRAKAAQKSVEIGRHPEFDRAQDHTVRMTAFRELRACAELLMISREEMNKKLDNQRDTATANSRMLTLAIIGLALVILIAIWDKHGFWTPWDEPKVITPPAASSPPNNAIAVQP